MAALVRGLWLHFRAAPGANSSRFTVNAVLQWSMQQRICQPFSTAADQATFDTLSRYRERPWEYLESEEYIERYGNRLVWADYRRNHKGAIPPQKTRKTCIRGDKVSGNPCPICRDPKIQVDYRNVKLLEQFICSHSGETYHPTRTGVCRKQFKNLTKAIQDAKDHGLLRFQVPHVEVRPEDYCGTHGAVGKTPPPPQQEGPWYSWYQWQAPTEKEVARVRQMYQPFLKENVVRAPSETT